MLVDFQKFFFPVLVFLYSFRFCNAQLCCNFQRYLSIPLQAPFTTMFMENLRSIFLLGNSNFIIDLEVIVSCSSALMRLLEPKCDETLKSDEQTDSLKHRSGDVYFEIVI